MVLIRAPVMAVTLLAIGLFVIHTSAASRGCCRSYTQGRIPFAVIRGYSVQTVTEMCPINAIIFHTKRRTACTNPALDWVMDYVEKLRKKAQMVHRKSSQA